MTKATNIKLYTTSYDVELAAKTMQSLTIENASSTYSLTGIWELNIDNENGKHQPY